MLCNLLKENMKFRCIPVGIQKNSEFKKTHIEIQESKEVQVNSDRIQKKGFLIFGILILVFNINLVFAADLNYTTGNSVYGILADSGNTNVTGALNLTLQMGICSLANCSDASWSAVYTNASYTSLASLANATYFQYKTTFFTENQNYTSYLFNVTVDYTYLDITFPQISFGNGTAVDYSNLSQNWIYVNVSVNETNLANITFSLYNDTSTVNTTIFNSSVYTINWTNLSVSNYTYQVNVSDFAGNKNATSLRHIWLDYIAPNATLLMPLNNTYSNVSLNNFTANISDNLGLKNATLNIYNSSNSLINSTLVANYSSTGTLTKNIGVVVSLIDDVYKWFYSVFDFFDNQYNTQNNTLTIDITYPLISFNPPTPDNYTGRSQNFVANISIAELNLANITWNWNGVTTIFNSSGSNLTSASNITIINITNTTNTNWIVLFNQSGLIPGLTYTYSAGVVDFAGNPNSTETRTLKGAVAPSYVSITQYPLIADYDSLDPGVNVTINTSLYDPDNNFDIAILQWKNLTQSSWTNVTMTNTTAKGFYTNVSAVLTLPNYEDNITYRIWANDTASEVSNSSSYTIQSSWDCTWSVSPSTLEEVVGFYEDKPIGNITLINTGDSNYSNNNCSISFTIGYTGFSQSYAVLTADPTNWVSVTNRYFQYTSPIIVSASSNQTIQINASFPYTTSSFTETPTIKITSSINDSITKNKTAQISSTLIISPPNPLLYQKIATYPSTYVFLTPGNFSLEAYIRNLGYDDSNADNTTAYNVSFNWTLPSEISSRISEGNETNFYEKLNTSSKQYNNLTIGLTSGNLASMSKGTFDITIYSYGYENESGNLSLISNSGNQIILNETVAIQFLCYDTLDGICVSSCGIGVDPDCKAATTASASSGGGGGSATPQTLAVATSAGFQLVRGKENEVKIVFENKDANTSLTDLVFSVSGNIAKYIDINPKTMGNLGPKQNATIILTITSPTYIELGKQALTITMKAQKGAYSYTDSKRITLEIHELSIESADQMLNESIDLINQLNEANLSSDSLDLLLNQSEEALKTFDLEVVRDNSNTIATQVKYALDSNKIINELSSLIKTAQEKGIDVSESSRLLELAQLSMERREFEQAYKRVKDSQMTYALEVKGEFGKLSYYLKEYPKEISFGAFFLIIFSFGAYNLNRLRAIKKRIKELKDEEKILNELIRVVQNQCFKEKKMSMSEYETAMKEYNKKLSNVVEELIELETKRAQVLRFTSKTKRLKIEKEKIISLIKEMQVDYMKKKKIETRTYELKMDSFNKRLAEIEEKFATLETKKALKGIGVSFKIPK